ncbi:ras guanine nucleotide exchange factor B-like [Teleopsis dalmanni]|uniref:ras guanine nucleotide exchange factor B-like n=1 Tax=Teleopsis dalmanni TaxID=139649 RepID=UPI0018CE6504|nr:ras guanine nucleotide exchange factor B-like [Teleopsis dalmanni]
MNTTITTATATVTTRTTTTTTSAKISANNTNNMDNTNMSSSKKLLLKNQLHLNLNVIEHSSVDNDDSSKRHVAIGAKGVTVAEAGLGTAVKVKKGGSNVETVTTVPQQHLYKKPKNIEASTSTLATTVKTAIKTTSVPVAVPVPVPLSSTAVTSAAVVATTTITTSTSSSLLNSSPTALAKFNRIIDSTVPVTNCYQYVSSKRNVAPPMLNSQLQQRLALAAYPTDIVSTDSYSDKIISTIPTHVSRQSATATATATATVAEKVEEISTSAATTVKTVTTTTKPITTTTLNDDNQMKRNDVHYLLKQLNSFSDIEEIEIVDIKQRQQEQEQEQQQQQQTQQHQQMPQQYSYNIGGVVGTIADKPHSPTATSLVIISPSSLSHKGIRRYASLHHQQHLQDFLVDSGADNAEQQQQYLLQQFDDYIFQSCHYLETNYFAANYRTAMVESSSHEFRPSTTTGTSATSESSAQSLDLHDDAEPPSVIYKATPSLPPSTLPPLTATTTMLRYETQTRLTSSGVQTELTASSPLSTSAVFNASLAKSSSSSGCSEEQRRRAPFFKCCYTPIDRWREKRNAANIAAAAERQRQRQRTDNTASGGGGGSGSGSGNANIGVDVGVGVGTSRGSATGASRQQHVRKNGHAV